MKVFISWSGDQSRSLALALKEWMPMVLQYVDPWLSQSDIDAGERWDVKIAKELEAANYGIICVTKANIYSPWLLFEAGALAKSMEDGKVIPLLLDIDFKEISGPLAQFQAKKVEKEGIFDVISAINKIASAPLSPERLTPQFDALWPTLEARISDIPKNATPAKHIRKESEILEELVSGVRGLEIRLRDGLEEGRSIGRGRKRRSFHPEMIMEMRHMIGDGPDDPIQILFLASLLRDDAPWAYELGLELYRNITGGQPKEAQKTYRKFLNALNILSHGPFAGEIIDKPTYMLLREATEMIEHSFDALLDTPHRRRPKHEEMIEALLRVNEISSSE